MPMIIVGGASLPPLDRAAIETSVEYSNIMIIGSAIHEIAILKAITRLGPERICFGSDTPFRLMHVQLAKYRALMRDLDETARCNILGGNIARALAIAAGS